MISTNGNAAIDEQADDALSVFELVQAFHLTELGEGGLIVRAELDGRSVAVVAEQTDDGLVPLAVLVDEQMAAGLTLCGEPVSKTSEEEQ